LDETIKRGGTQKVKGKVAYVEQEPFIFSATVADNITFGKKFNQERFDASVKAAQLESDLGNLSNGANTVIGERGINISGGQRARISLARAVYSDADIYLFDDPLSAVDPQVANAIFKECILGALKNKCVILVTH
jgi:ATP-binding cassette subfamily C (CFTR/MRP) protein 4